MNKTMRYCIAVVFFLALHSNSVSQEIHTLKLQLINSSGFPVGPAGSSVLNYPFYSDSILKNVIVYSKLPKGVYEILISAKGYAEQVIRIDLNQSMDTTIYLKENYKQLDDVVVTSEKAQTRWLASSQSITTLNARNVESARIWSLEDINRLSPNLTMGHSGDGRNITGMRGIVTTSYEQAVATYIDGIAQFNLDTYIPMVNEIESIEIIRGNQGTLYGRNSLGGVINITTKQPSNKATAHADLQFGNYGLNRWNAGLSLPIIKNKLYSKINVLRESRNGYYTNEYTKSSFDDQAQLAVDGQLKYVFNKKTLIQLLYKRYQSTNSGAFPLVNNLTELFENPYQLAQNNVAEMKDKTENISFVFQNKGKKMDILFQSAYQNNYRYYTNALDADFSPAAIVSVFNNYGKSFNFNKVLTQELRVSSKKSVDNSKISWTTGLYQFTQSSPTKQAVVFGEDAGFIGVPDKNFALISKNQSKNNGFAAFGQLTIPLSASFQLKMGLRWDREIRNLTIGSEYEKQPFAPIATRADTSGKISYSAVSPKLILEYKNNENQLMFLSYSRGFRSGGLTPVGSDPSQVPLVGFEPEYVSSFEAGWKGENQNKTFRYAVSLFYNQLQNIQTSFLTLPDAVTLIENAGTLDARGAEWEIATKLSNRIELIYNGGITDAKFRSLKSVSNGQEIDLTGKNQLFTPRTTQLLIGQWQSQIKKGNLQIRGEVQRTGKQYFDLANTISQKAYVLINFRMSYSISKWQFSLWGRNLLGTKFIDYAYDFGAAHLGRPLTFGGGLRFSL
ncbi:MAG: TonB-dependent receptor [Chitinophagaceae bacterium]|jgi:iron complex outermembrane receptor protein